MVTRSPGDCSRTRRTCAGETTPPPVNTWRSPRSASGRWSATRWNRPAVSQAWVTPAARRNRARLSGVGSAGGWTTTVVPLASGTSSSRVEASKASGDSRSIDAPGRSADTSASARRSAPAGRSTSANRSASSTRRSTARCGTTTPLGTPVVPEVKET